MSKGLRNMSKEEQKAAIARRLEKNTGGLGYWAAVDAKRKIEAQKGAENSGK